MRNIEHFRRLLDVEKDPAAIKALTFLLAREEQRLAAIGELRRQDTSDRRD